VLNALGAIFGYTYRFKFQNPSSTNFVKSVPDLLKLKLLHYQIDRIKLEHTAPKYRKIRWTHHNHSCNRRNPIHSPHCPRCLCFILASVVKTLKVKRCSNVIFYHIYINVWQTTLDCWQEKWCVRSSVNVTTSTILTSSVSGPTAQSWHNLQLSQLVDTKILSYRASLTVTFSPSWQSFVLLQGTCWPASVFGSTSKRFLSAAFTGLTALH